MGTDGPAELWCPEESWKRDTEEYGTAGEQVTAVKNRTRLSGEEEEERSKSQKVIQSLTFWMLCIGLSTDLKRDRPRDSPRDIKGNRWQTPALSSAVICTFPFYTNTTSCKSEKSTIENGGRGDEDMGNKKKWGKKRNAREEEEGMVCKQKLNF